MKPTNPTAQPHAALLVAMKHGLDAEVSRSEYARERGMLFSPCQDSIAYIREIAETLASPEEVRRFCEYANTCGVCGPMAPGRLWNLARFFHDGMAPSIYKGLAVDSREFIEDMESRR